MNLEDLSLFNNRIAKIDSLDALVKLQVLSLGNNQIGNMRNVSSRPRAGAAPLLLLLASRPGARDRAGLSRASEQLGTGEGDLWPVEM